MCIVWFVGGRGRAKNKHLRRHRSCRTCLDAGKWLPVALLAALWVYCYYVYVVAFSTHYLLYRLQRKTQSALYIAFFHVLLLPTIFCYIRCVVNEPGEAAKYRLLFPDNPQNSECTAADDDGREIKYVDTDRFCGVCQQPKPERSHHCSECNTCVLRMDHHCVMLNNCVGFANYRLFVLLNLYGFLFCAFVAATLLQILIWQLAEGRLFGNSIQFLIICVYAFGVGLCCLALFVLHCYLIFANRTTIEHMQRKELQEDGGLDDTWYGYKYNVGWGENWRQVFGDNPWLWFVPCAASSKGDGVTFPKRQPANV